ncbi:uncharacterized protein V1477_005706 [Vespula maculifrons]|uniref:Secreted protein n=1 Tax=Vespula maculifrons TaxID=7453 RepID=A0ABD2CLS5_VESMC
MQNNKPIIFLVLISDYLLGLMIKKQIKTYFPYCQYKTAVVRIHAVQRSIILPTRTGADRCAPDHTEMERDNNERFKTKVLDVDCCYINALGIATRCFHEPDN